MNSEEYFTLTYFFFDVFGHRWGRNGEFCVAVDPVTRTTGILVQISTVDSLAVTLSRPSDWLYASVIASLIAGSKVAKAMSSFATDVAVYA